MDLLTKKTSMHKVTFLCSTRISFGISMIFCLTTGGADFTVLPLSIAMLLPYTVVAVRRSATERGQSLITLDWSAHFKSVSEGNAKPAWRFRTLMASLSCRCEKSAMLFSTVSMKQWRLAIPLGSSDHKHTIRCCGA